ncbi:MAG: DUF6382 domain-containing protein [Butyrivibrio sp.]|nr:DUF6382 domain-containing protein [Butyrivibrio sp.]
MEQKFYRDLKHSYAVCSCGTDIMEKKDTRYQLKIMESGRIPKLLKSSLRKINQENFIYYDISSMMSLEDRYSSRGMGYDELMQLFSDMKIMIEGLSEHLLGNEGIVLDCKSVFCNLSSGEYQFMYYPNYGENAPVEAFFESVLCITDHDDERAVELIYGLCDKAQLSEVLLIDILSDLLKEPEEEKIELIKEPEVYFEEEEEIEEPEETGMERAKRRLSGKAELFFSLLFVAVIIGLMYIRVNYVLTKEENLLSIAIMLVSGVTGAVAFLSGLKTMNGPKKEKEVKEYEEDIEEYDNYDDFGDEVSYDIPIHVTASIKEAKKLDLGQCEETVVLDAEETEHMTLYSRNMDKTIRICLDKLPITIGKMEGCVDRVLSDASVSRIHCKFLRDENGVALVDLGSTNGSFRNGLKLVPQEKNYIEEGDEVKLGRICFDIR